MVSAVVVGRLFPARPAVLAGIRARYRLPSATTASRSGYAGRRVRLPPVASEEATSPTGAQMRGVHAGAVVFVGVLALNLGNYVFHLIAARSLGPALYGDLATLIAISGLIALPLGGIQIWVARYVAHYTAVGDDTPPTGSSAARCLHRDRRRPPDAGAPRARVATEGRARDREHRRRRVDGA